MEVAEKLPRGRHGLSREDVARSQRERLLRAMAEAVSELGYANTPVADRFLVRGGPAFLGGFIELASTTQWDSWGRFTRALRTGEHQDDSPMDNGKEMFRTYADDDPDRIRRIMTAMDSHSTRVAVPLAEHVDWARYRTFADLGGARGNLATLLVKAHPHLQGSCFDKPPAEPFFDEHVAAAGVADRVRFVGGDFFADELPRADVLIYGHVLNNWDEQTRSVLIRRAYRALSPGGLLVVYDRMIDESTLDPFVLTLSLTFMLTSPGGSQYRLQECEGWLRKAGFAEVTATPILENHTLMIARR